jgi:hypothetical protein
MMPRIITRIMRIIMIIRIKNWSVVFGIIVVLLLPLSCIGETFGEDNKNEHSYDASKDQI